MHTGRRQDMQRGECIMRACERFLKYVTVMTPSDEDSVSVPSSKCQFELADLLVKEMKQLGIEDAKTDDKCYVYGSIPAAEGCESSRRLGFIAHMDTVSDFAEHPVRPLIHEHYDGGTLMLGESGRVLSPEVFGHLSALKGRTLITSDGTTILGADDKAGIAAILTMAEELKKREIPHGKISIAFTPDEEIGRGAEHFDVGTFGADFAYTVDGGAEGEIEYENFNACEAVFQVKGINVHPGSAKDIMVNAGAVACEIQAMLPEKETPAHTEGYEGFYHLVKMNGNCEKAVLVYIVRDHDTGNFEKREQTLRRIEEKINKKYGKNTVELQIKEQYRNMAEKIRPCFHLIENAQKACENTGVKPRILPIRGGTDGARLSFMGLPCPNLGTGGYAFHGPYEHITAEGMDAVVEILLQLAELYGRNE